MVFKHTFFLGFFLLIVTAKAAAFFALEGQIHDQNGQILHIDGVNWAGFQDSAFVDELYGAIPFYALEGRADFGLIDMLTHPWDNPRTNVDKNTGVAFKTIRLPIQPRNLYDTAENRHFRLDLSDTNHKEQGNGVFCGRWDTQRCQAGLTVAESLFKIIDEFKKNKMNVLVDFHQTPVSRNGNVTENNYSLQDYRKDVGFLAAQLKTRQLDNVVGIDVFNEPHNLNWYNSVNNQPAWIEVIAQAAMAVYQNNPDLLLFVEGPGANYQSPVNICLAKHSLSPDPQTYTLAERPDICGQDQYLVTFKANWGEDFKDLLDANAAKQGQAVFDSARFQSEICQRTGESVCHWLLGDPNAGAAKSHLVFSPHIYGQHVAGWQSSSTSSPLRFDWNFGFLANAGYPVVIGEAGYDTHQQQDVTFFEQSIIPYLKQKGMNHHLFFWTWNTNSGDTGGVRLDQNTIELNSIKEKNLNVLFTD